MRTGTSRAFADSIFVNVGGFMILAPIESQGGAPEIIFCQLIPPLFVSKGWAGGNEAGYLGRQANLITRYK